MIDSRAASGIKAAIFDMDGVLLDSEPLHHRAVNRLLAEEGPFELSFDEYAPYMGTTDIATWTDLVARYQLPRPVEYYLDRYDTTILEHYRSSSEIAPGARWLIEGLKQRGLRLAVASSSRRAWVETCLDALDLRECFDALATGDMVRRSKPDPEIFRLAARLLDIEPERCLAIEDSPNGVASAVAAGMLTVAIETPYTRSQGTQAAQIHLHSLNDFNWALLHPGDDARSVVK